MMDGARKWASAAKGLVLLAAVICAYLPVTRAGFIWDDDDYVTRNRTLLDLHGLRRIWLEPGAVPQYYPLVHTTFWVERHLWGLRPAGYHITNVLLHALTALLLWRALVRLRVPGAWFIAAVFALHPLQVESVAWVTERKNVLSGVFFLLSLLAFLRLPGAPGAGSGDSRAERGVLPWLLLSLGAFLCALFSKTVAGSLPLAILLIEYWRTGKVSPRTILRLVPFLILAGLAAVVTIVMERQSVRAVGPEWDLSLLERARIAGRALWFYPWKMLLPVGLSFVYPRWQPGGADPAGLVGLAGFAGLLLLLYRGREAVGRGALCAVLYYVVTIFPALGFFNIYPMRYTFVADHYQYLAGTGIVVAVVGAVLAGGSAAGLASRCPERLRRNRRQGWAALIPVVVLAVLAVLTFQRSRVFESPESLWLDTIAHNPGAWMAHHNLGKYYEDSGRTKEAVEQYRAALKIRPDLDQTLYNLGNVEAAAGSLDQAEADYREALRVNPRFAEAWNNLGNVLRKSSRLQEAIEAYRRAVALDPGYVTARRNLGIVLADAGDVAGAIDALRKAVAAEPEDAATGTRLAWLLATAADPRLRDAPAAVSLAERACRSGRGGSPQQVAVLAVAYAAAGRMEDAARAAERALPGLSAIPEMRAKVEAVLAQARAGGR